VHRKGNFGAWLNPLVRRGRLCDPPVSYNAKKRVFDVAADRSMKVFAAPDLSIERTSSYCRFDASNPRKCRLDAENPRKCPLGALGFRPTDET